MKRRSLVAGARGETMQNRLTSAFPDWRLAASVMFGAAALGVVGAILFRGFDRNLLLAAAVLQAASTILGFMAGISRAGATLEETVTALVADRFEMAYAQRDEPFESAPECGDPTTDP